MKPLRCAIYTRKSSEEGLEQGFNSLHAQRDACAAYVLSQAGEGWTELPTIYDDGGFSGGSMDRPGLKALLADINAGRIDIVVVYKVDRLTRSLADFARIIEQFDAKGVSFVSVTQAFNTTNSMGRLTLNVLLSFAQFEREVTGERIRDKIAASKAKGLWMGGSPPLGYDPVDRKLVVNEAEAESVRYIFRRFLELKSINDVVEDLAARGLKSKSWINRHGLPTGGCGFGRTAVNYLLSNPVYLGAIRHKKIVYWDAHPPIIDRATWDAVQAVREVNAPDYPDTDRFGTSILLKNKVFDPRGVPMAVTHSTKDGRRYRYYTARDIVHGGASAGRRMSRVSMGTLDAFILSEAPQRLKADYLPDLEPTARIRSALQRVQVTEEAVIIRLHHAAASSQIEHLPGRVEEMYDGIEITLPITLKQRSSATIIEAPNTSQPAGRMDRALVRAITLASTWADRLASGEVSALSTMAKTEGYCERYASKLLPLAWLAPDLLEMILEGRQPRALSLGALIKHPIPMNWDEQRQLIHSIGAGGSA